MDRGAWWATVHGVIKELEMTFQLNNNSYLLLSTNLKAVLGQKFNPCPHQLYGYSNTSSINIQELLRLLSHSLNTMKQQWLWGPEWWVVAQSGVSQPLNQPASSLSEHRGSLEPPQHSCHVSPCCPASPCLLPSSHFSVKNSWQAEFKLTLENSLLIDDWLLLWESPGSSAAVGLLPHLMHEEMLTLWAFFSISHPTWVRRSNHTLKIQEKNGMVVIIGGRKQWGGAKQPWDVDNSVWSSRCSDYGHQDFRFKLDPSSSCSSST